MIFEAYDRIVFAGDSVTDMGSTQPVGEGLFDALGTGYVRIIDSLLAAWYPETPLRITNSGVSGNTSRDLLARFSRDVVSLKPDWVSICIGINDVWRQFDSPGFMKEAVENSEYRENLRKMILLVKDKTKGVFIASPYYIEPLREDKMRQKMDQYGQICKELANEYGCRFIDFQSMFSKYCGYRHSSSLSWDRVHPNQVGSVLMAKTFLKQCEFDFSKML